MFIKSTLDARNPQNSIGFYIINKFSINSIIFSINLVLGTHFFQIFS